MNVFELGFALVGFLALVAVVPAWMFFVRDYQAIGGLPTEVQFLAALSLPAVALLFLASWLQPG
jgi:hypothetical protein